jgi:hypothetical protein
MEYELSWRNKFLTADANTLDEMISTLQAATDELRAMRAAGVTLDPCGMEDDYARLVTDDPKVAEQFGFSFTEYEPEDDAVGVEAEFAHES